MKVALRYQPSDAGGMYAFNEAFGFSTECYYRKMSAKLSIGTPIKVIDRKTQKTIHFEVVGHEFDLDEDLLCLRVAASTEVNDILREEFVAHIKSEWLSLKRVLNREGYL